MRRLFLLTLAVFLNGQVLTLPLEAQVTVYNFGGDELNLSTSLRSNGSKVGDAVRAQVNRPFMANGKFLPKGSTVSGTVLYVQPFQPAKMHKKEVITPARSARIEFDLDQAKLPDGSMVGGLDIHLQRLSYLNQTPYGVPFLPGLMGNTVTLSQAEYEGRKVNQLDYKWAIEISDGAKLTVSEERKLRPALARYGTVEALDLIPGTDLGPVLSPFIRSISSAWKDIAGRTQASFPMPSMTVLEFDIDSAGNLWNLQMARSAGLREYDLAAIRAVVRARQAAPHIANLEAGKKLPLRMSFLYGQQAFVPPESSTGPPVPVPIEATIQPAMLADCGIVSVLLDHDGVVRDAVAVDPPDPALAGQAVIAAKAIRFTPFGQSIGAPLKHSVMVIPLTQLASRSNSQH
jgi:hypothetical protein